MRTIDEYFTRVRELVQGVADAQAERESGCASVISRS
ncbi:MAG: hypothetical protein HW419_3386 [Deltaproteobacteria bacterium]|nr:hypothetical protein [Deltaproteobacteria bacterium]